MKKEKTIEIIHEMPTDLLTALISIPAVKILWDNLTPLARNEWICWITSAKKPETRQHRVKRACNDLSAGKRRPCCWPGCTHRGSKIKNAF